MQEHECRECGIAMALVRVLPALAVCCLSVDPGVRGYNFRNASG